MLPESAGVLLEQSGIVVHSEMRERLAAHVALVREWNAVSGLVSRGDEDQLWPRHVVDSLSLAPYVLAQGGNEAGGLLDIGTGGGFPAIPLKILFPGLPLTLVERTAKKVGFLRKAIAAGGLECVRVFHGAFPQAFREPLPALVTARAVERGAEAGLAVVERLPAGSVFLCQSGDPSPWLPETFHVEHVVDDWRRQGLRRGSLYLIRRLD